MDNAETYSWHPWVILLKCSPYVTRRTRPNHPTWKCVYFRVNFGVRCSGQDNKVAIHIIHGRLATQVTKAKQKMTGHKSSAHVHECSPSSAKMIVFSPETQTARRSAIVTRIATEVRDSRPIPEKIWVATLPPLLPPPSSPAMALCGELAALFILRTMRYGLKETDALICLYCFLPCLDQTAWCELYDPLLPHLSSSLLIFRQIKLLEKSVSHLLHIFSHDATWRTKEMEIFPRRKLPSRWRLCAKYHKFFFLVFLCAHSQTKVQPSANTSHWKLTGLQEIACTIMKLIQAITGKNITVGHEK